MLWNRIAAFGYDYILISAYLIGLAALSTMISSALNPDVWQQVFSNPIGADLFAFATTILPVALYFAWTESSSSQASWGKRKRGIRVETSSGQRLSLGRALSRNLLKLLPWQVAHTCLFHIPGWPLNTGTPPLWVSIGLVLVWILIGWNAWAIGASKSRTSPYDRLLGIRCVRVAT